MTKKNIRRQLQRKKFPWMFIGIDGALWIAAFLFANRTADAGGTPSIAVDQQKIDFGYVKLGGYRSFKIKVTNNGTGTLRFKETPYIEVVKGCCQPDLTVTSMAVNPGQ